jgi:hypothetical protein
MPRIIIEIDSVADADYMEDRLKEMITPGVLMLGDAEIEATWTREDYPKQSLFLKIIPEE